MPDPLPGIPWGNSRQPFFFTVFNVVVDAVIRHWVTVSVPIEVGEEGLRDSIEELMVFFFADDGLVALPRTERFQRLLNVLTDLFDQVGFRTNMRKTVRLAFWTCNIPGR